MRILLLILLLLLAPAWPQTTEGQSVPLPAEEEPEDDGSLVPS